MNTCYIFLVEFLCLDLAEREDEDTLSSNDEEVNLIQIDETVGSMTRTFLEKLSTQKR